MQKTILKQVLFLIFIALILVLLMGLLIFTSAKAEGKSDSRPKALFSWASSSPAIFEDDEEEFSFDKRKNHAMGNARYNRVEGFYLGMSLNKKGDNIYPYSDYASRAFLFGHTGYAFALKEFQYQIGMEKGFFEDNRLAFGGEYHRTVETPDRWIISDNENSLAAFLLKEDFQDFYFSEGASGYVSQNFSPALKLTLSYLQDDWSSSKKNTNWSLFGGHKNFRLNPAMDEGNLRSIMGRVVLDTRNSAKKTTRGFYVQLEGEYAGRGLKGDFNFDRIVADARWYWTSESWEGLDFRFRGGTSYGNLPWQKTYYLGGISTLRGFAYKAFPAGPMVPGGNRMALFQVEYRMGREEFPFGLDLGFFEQFNLILFGDLGWIGQAGAHADMWKGFNGCTIKTMKNDVGLALANRSGNMRFEVARRTDTSYKPFAFLFRIERPF